MLEEKVSVIIPAYNAERTLKDAVESALLQGEGVGEVIIVVNGCEDETFSIAKSLSELEPKVKVLESAKGRVPARNVGIKNSSFPYIALLDSDDVWLEGKIDKQLNRLKNGADVVGTQILTVRPDLTPYEEQITHPTQHDEIINMMLNGKNPLANSSVVFRSKLLEYTGNYDDIFTPCEDFHLWLRCIKFAKIENLDERLTLYRFEPRPYDPLIPIALSQFYCQMYIHTGVVQVA